jgi:diguanylate cyclase (GGDEF)-like protein
MERMDPSILRNAAGSLRRVVDDHAAWHENLLRAMFCDHPVDPRDLSPTAHRDCAFGRWFYEAAPNSMRGLPEFTVMGKEHQQVHQAASRLLRAVRVKVPIDRLDFEELVAANARMRMQVDTLRAGIDAALGHRDALTTAYGRVDLLPALEELQGLTRDGGTPCSLVFVDVDNLKQINDQHGHLRGDQVLAGLVEHLDAHLRPQDKVFRYGGDEFLLALPGADIPVANSIANRMRVGLASRLLIVGQDGQPLRITASFGLALLDPHEDLAVSIARADQALLLAKAAGRNRLIAWDESVLTGTRWRRIEAGQASR